MKKASLILLCIFMISCSKNEDDNFIFEKTWNSGIAEDVIISSDSTYVIAGRSGDSPFIISLNQSGSRIMEYVPELNGAFTSISEDSSGYIAAGYSSGQILISFVDDTGELQWSVSSEISSEVKRAIIKRKNDDRFLVLAGNHPDSTNSDLFKIIEIDRSGNIIAEDEIDMNFELSVSDFAIGSNGNIYLAMAKSNAGSKQKASVAMISIEGNILWETELYNNSKFAAACKAIEIAENGDIFVAGRTELTSDNTTLENSFLASLTANGVVETKKYLENSNCGVDIAFDDFDRILMLNRNCFIIDIIGLNASDDINILRTFEVCDPYETSAYASAMKINHDGNYILAGENSGKIFYGLRKKDVEKEEVVEQSN